MLLNCNPVGDSSMLSILAHIYLSTITVSGTLWFRLPDLAVTVAVYVPTGVPDIIDDEPPPPHPAMARNAIATVAIASGTRRR
jgi:hypothetical protein